MIFQRPIRARQRPRRFFVLVIILATLAACGKYEADPFRNNLEIYRTDNSFEDVVGRMKKLVRGSKWLSWMTRTMRCFEMGETAQQWRLVCGLTLGGPTTDPSNPGFRYDRWLIVNRLENGSEILTTKATYLWSGRKHPNQEIFDKIGIKAQRVGTRKRG